MKPEGLCQVELLIWAVREALGVVYQKTKSETILMEISISKPDMLHLQQPPTPVLLISKRPKSCALKSIALPLPVVPFQLPKSTPKLHELSKLESQNVPNQKAPIRLQFPR